MPSVLKVNEVQSDTDLPLVFNVGNAERGRIDTSGNMGLGAVPNTWTIFKALELGAAGTGLAAAAGQPVLFSNCYYNGGWKYEANGFAANYDQINGQHRWFNVASGTADANISFTQAMTLDASGRLLVGTSTAITSWGSGAAQQIQATASGVAYPGFSSYSFSNTAGAGGMLNLGHSRGATVGTMTATQSGDVLGYLIFEGVNSSNALTGGAYIYSVQTAAAGASYIPGALVFFTSDATSGNAERARFNSTGAFVFAGGTSTADGIGITFPATQSASTNANTLDDYEEGNWTPVVQGSSAAGVTSYTAQEGRYTKIGRQVTVTFYIDVTAATGTGNFQMTGLPFASSSTNQSAGALMTWNLNWVGGTSIVSYLGTTSTLLQIYTSGDDIAWQNQTLSNEAFSLIGSHTYFTA